MRVSTEKAATVSLWLSSFPAARASAASVRIGRRRPGRAAAVGAPGARTLRRSRPTTGRARGSRRRRARALRPRSQQRPYDPQYAGESGRVRADRACRRRCDGRARFDAKLRRGRAGAGQLAVVAVAFACGSLTHLMCRLGHDPALDVLSGLSRRRVQVEPLPRPTSSRERASFTSLRRLVCLRRLTSADAPRWSGVPVYGRSSAPVATSHTSHAGVGSVARLRASATSVPTPDALSSAPGAGGTLSVCAIAITRQSAGESLIPITSRDMPFPGTRNRS